MIKPKAFQLVAVALAAGVLIGAAADRAISRLDVRGMSDGEKNRQVRSDLLSILRPSKSLFHTRMLSLDGDIWLHTRAVATEFQSLCQRDTLSLYYATTERVGRHEEWPAAPYGLSAERTYRFVSAPKTQQFESASNDDRFRSRFVSECRGADEASKDDEWTGWFTAKFAEEAMLGGFAMLALEEWIKDPSHQYLSCANEGMAEPCQQRGKALLSLENIGAVNRCSPNGPNEICFVLGRWGPIWTIRAKNTHAPIKPEDIISVDYEEQIIVT